LQVLVNNTLQGGFPDYACMPGSVDIRVRRMVTLRRVSGLYFERTRSARMVFNYVAEIGVGSTIKKVLSRSAERYRNEKFLSIGFGVTAADGGGVQYVVFVATRHPRCVDRIVLPGALVARVADPPVVGAEGAIEHVDLSGGADAIPAWLDAAGGWDPESGEDAPVIDWAAVTALGKTSAQLRAFPISAEAPTTTGSGTATHVGITGTLFGYGNYAKTVILPSLPKQLVIRRIHEIDPLQVPRNRDPEIAWSTSPVLATDDASKVVFIAGYHHSHGPLTVAALARDKDCVVEKPLVTSRAQLAELDLALQKSKGRFFACFQKRYSRFNDWARSDLGVKVGDPINYHAIVYEVPLPDKHWYRWASSRSRLVSNGCHWVDHFLFLNEWSMPQTWNVQSAADGTLSVFVTLQNGACMTMTLTDIGSERIGVQDHIQLRAGRVTVRLNNDSDYVAESSSRILRRTRINKMTTYRDMYAQIGRKIVAGVPGDSRQSIVSSASLVLDLEDAMSFQDPNLGS
jgi:predicted dehydrogenase